MAILQTIRDFLFFTQPAEAETIVPAPPTEYSLKPITQKNISEVLRLNVRCFRNGENYSKHTFNYLLTEPNALSYQTVTAAGQMAGFLFLIMNPDGAAHITSIGVAPEHRRRGLAERLLTHAENALRSKGLSTVVLEVRIGNAGAQALYRKCGYNVVQRVKHYYSNGEDGYLMTKSLI
jgi:[ribosomal protein S18]-alanine N-acetyltransferase